MTREEQNIVLNRLRDFAFKNYKKDLDLIICSFINSKDSCTHEIVRIDQKGCLTCRCGSIMRWPEK